MDEAKQTSDADESSGGQGEILCDPHHVRSDARLAARILSLGVVSEEDVAKLLVRGVKLAGRMAAKDKAREFAAVMGVYIAAAKLELETKRDERAEKQPTQPAGVFINVNGGDGRVELSAVDMRAELLRERDYLEFQRQRALEIDADSRPVRANGEPRAVEDGTAPGSPGPLGSGSGNGQANGHHH